MLQLYRILSYILIPILNWKIRKRINIGKEDKLRFKEKFGITSHIKSKTEKLIWFHAVSIGEVNSLWKMFEEILKEKDITILITTSTMNSAMLVLGVIERCKWSDRVIHQFAPIDIDIYINRFLNYWKPNILVMVDSEFWPMLIYQLDQRNIPMISLNSRISERSFLRWKRFAPNFIKSLLAKYTLIIPQEQIDYDRIKILQKGDESNMKFIGNLKYDTKLPFYSEAEFDKLKAQVGNRKIWLVVSTHDPEEQIIIKTHLRLKVIYTDLLTIIIPRHIIRKSEILNMTDKLQILRRNVAIRSDKDEINDNHAIYLADTIGEIAVFAKLCEIIFIGGSLVKFGGHNPLEAVRFNSAILSGKYYHNFIPMYEEMKARDAVVITDVDNLYDDLYQLFENENKRNLLIKNANNYLQTVSDIAIKAKKEIMKFL